LINGRSVLAVIPARGGSKGIKDKNIRELAGKPLIAWTIEAAKKSKYIDRAIVSTDSPKIAEISRTWGAETPFNRPPKLATDRASTNDVILHCLKWIHQNEHKTYDYFVLLQPTSPLRNSAHIDDAVEKMIADRNADSLVSIVESKENPYWTKIIDKKGRLRPFLPDREHHSRRQDLPKTYVLNGAIYISKSKTFMTNPDLFGGKCLPYIMDRESSVDIDDEDDFFYAEYLIARRKT
jgi:N-acylneuraminate cytidylyltransferase/CMP-N,N'-diacetyllegionaminic acid synthase